MNALGRVKLSQDVEASLQYTLSVHSQMFAESELQQMWVLSGIHLVKGIITWIMCRCSFFDVHVIEWVQTAELLEKCRNAVCHALQSANRTVITLYYV